MDKGPSGGGAVAKLLRDSVASVGPGVSAGAQFVLSLVLVRVLAPAAFGSFAFLLVASQFSWGLWSALFCAPLPILLNQGDAEARRKLLKCLFSTNLLVAGFAGAVFFGLGVALHVPTVAALLFGVYGMIALLRWFARAYAYAIGTPLRTMTSDLVYGAALIAGVGVAFFERAGSLEVAYASLLLSAAFGLLPFGWSYLKQQFGSFSLSAVREYDAIWRRHSGWSLLGVLTTEATANSHVYIVTLFFGPKAFAPIAASALMIRPIGVAMNALTEFERAQMARQIGGGHIDAAMGAVRYFRLVLIAAWVGTAALIVLLLAKDPRLIFPSHYALPFLITGAALWMGVAGMRLLRTPESALLQAAGAFRPLAYASVISSGISIVAVVSLLLFAGTLWSIGGIFLGEAMYAVWIWRQAGRWRRAETSRIAAEPAQHQAVAISP